MNAQLTENAAVSGALTVDLGGHVTWPDEFDTTPVAQQTRTSLGGTMIVEMLYPNPAGRKISLDCAWQSKSTLDQLCTMRDRWTEDQLLMTLRLCDGRQKSVLWNHEDGRPIQVGLIAERPEYEDEDQFEVTLNLIVIG